MYGPFDGECEEKEGEVVSKPMMQAMLRAGTALLVGGALAYSTSAMAQFPSFKLKNPPQTSASQKSGKRINIKQMRIVNGRLVLVGYDNKQRRLPNGLYRTTDGNQAFVRDGRIRYIVLQKDNATGGQAGTASTRAYKLSPNSSALSGYDLTKPLRFLAPYGLLP